MQMQIQACNARHLWFWLMLAGWLPHWERASHLALHHVHACYLNFCGGLYCSFSLGLYFTFNCILDLLFLLNIFTRTRHTFFTEVIQFTRAGDSPG